MPAEIDGAAPDLEQLSDTWREQAERYQADGALVGGAKLLNRVAEQLDAALHAHATQELTVAEAAELSGYSPERLRELADDRIPAERRGGRIYLRRCDLPRKPAERSPGEVVEGMASAILEAREAS